MLEPRSFFQSTSQPQHVQQIMNDEGIAGGMWVCSTLSLFGIAWMLSTFLRSGPISACVSIGATIAIISITAIYLDSYGSADKWGPVIFCFVTFSAGMTCLLGGTIYYLRRVAP
jgi:hypothetical protein